MELENPPRTQTPDRWLQAYMNPEINHIKVKRTCWIKFSNELVNIGFNGLPKDIHFTLSLNPQTKDLNFHVTRNTSDKDNKPKITVVLVDKLLIDGITESITIFLLRKLFYLIDIASYREQQEGGLYFIPHENFVASDYSKLVEQKFSQLAEKIAKHQSKRLAISPDIGAYNDFVELLQNDNHNDELGRQIIEFTPQVEDNFDGGMLIGDNESFFVAKINKHWYRQKDRLILTDFLRGFIGDADIRKIFWKAKRAIIRIKNANTYDEVKHFDRPFRIQRR